MELPKEIWKEISMTDSLTYLKMVQCCKAFKLDDDFIKDHFTKYHIRVSMSMYRLPNGDIHSCGDKPAIRYNNGHEEWWKNNLLHRDNDKPAIVYSSDRDFYVAMRKYNDKSYTPVDKYHMEWWVHGLQHRINGPAVIDSDGTEHWLQHGEFHRDDDLPAVCSKDEQVWYQHGKKHRDGDKPARIWGNIQEWYQHGVLYKTLTLTPS